MEICQEAITGVNCRPHIAHGKEESTTALRTEFKWLLVHWSHLVKQLTFQFIARI